MTKDELTAIDPPDGGRLVHAPGERWTLDDLGAALQSLVGDVR
jgi:hypothetical protein